VRPVKGARRLVGAVRGREDLEREVKRGKRKGKERNFTAEDAENCRGKTRKR
jgi:hypothetical protein